MRAETQTSSQPGANAYIHDLFAGFGPVTVRRMFGGSGVYAEGLMFALISGEVIYLKASPAGTAAFEVEGCGPFCYDTKHGRKALTSYWRMPERLYDDPDELAHWARNALAAAAQASATRKPIGRSKSPPGKTRRKA